MKHAVTLPARGIVLVPSTPPLGTSCRDGWRNEARAEEMFITSGEGERERKGRRRVVRRAGEVRFVL